MAIKRPVTGEIEKGIIVLRINYGRPGIPQLALEQELKSTLVRSYDSLAETCSPGVHGHSCIIVFEDVEVASSRTIKALYQLFERVLSRKGVLIVVDFPPDYIDSLRSLGLTRFREFILAGSTQQALAFLG